MYGVISGKLVTTKLTSTFHIIVVVQRLVIISLVVDVHTTTVVYNRIRNILAFLLGQLVPIPITLGICVLSKVLVCRLRNNNADLVVLIGLEDKLIVTCLRGLQANINVALQPPTGTVTVYHRCRSFISIPNSISAKHFNYFEFIEAIRFKRKSDAEGILIARSHLDHTLSPFGHRTGNIVIRQISLFYKTNGVSTTLFTAPNLRSGICPNLRICRFLVFARQNDVVSELLIAGTRVWCA